MPLTYQQSFLIPCLNRTAIVLCDRFCQGFCRRGYRNLWENIRKDMPTKGRGKGGNSIRLSFQRDFRPRCNRSTATMRRHSSCGRGRASRCPHVHPRLPEHRDLEARLRLYLRLSPATRMLLASRRNLRQASQAVQRCGALARERQESSGMNLKSG
jgi:hypothetical protein